MPGPPPKTIRRRRNVPERGDWRSSPGSGWRHGSLPAPPEGLLDATRAVWQTWMTAWYAAHWTPEYLPQLVTAIRLYDEVERGRFPQVTELRQWMDGLGITFKGQQDRRWTPPTQDEAAQPGPTAPADRFGHLRAIV